MLDHFIAKNATVHKVNSYYTLAISYCTFCVEKPTTLGPAIRVTQPAVSCSSLIVLQGVSLACYGKCVCPSVHLTHPAILSKRPKLRSRNHHCHICEGLCYQDEPQMTVGWSEPAIFSNFDRHVFGTFRDEAIRKAMSNMLWSFEKVVFEWVSLPLHFFR